MIVMTLKEGEIMNKNFLSLKDSLSLFKNKFDTLKFDYDKYMKTKDLHIKNLQDSFIAFNAYSQLKLYKIDSINTQLKMYRLQTTINTGMVSVLGFLMFSLLFFTTINK
jgi:hypothetical protein